MTTAAARIRMPVRIRRALGGSWAFRFSLAVVGITVIVVLFGPLLAPQDPNATNLLSAFQGPSAQHLLGTDGSGRDIFSRLLVGARSTVLPAVTVAILATTIGTAVAMFAAWRGGMSDRLAARGMDVVFAFPGLLVAILAVAMFGKGIVAPAVALVIVYVPYVGRIVRAAALQERSLPYVSALSLQGISTWGICWRHLLPNIRGVVAAQAVIACSYAVIDLAAINFLGLGIQPPAADWGLMVASGQSSILDGHYEECLFACLCIVVLIVSINVLGERIAPDVEEVTR